MSDTACSFMMARLFNNGFIISILFILFGNIEMKHLPSQPAPFFLTKPFTCPKGQFRVISPEGSSKCQDCPSDTFIDINNHTFEACKPCTKYIKSVDHVAETEECTRWSDTKIKTCETGFYIENTTLSYGCRCCVEFEFIAHSPSSTDHSGVFSSAAETIEGGFGLKTNQTSSSPETDSQKNLTSIMKNISCAEVVRKSNGCLSDEHGNKQCMENSQCEPIPSAVVLPPIFIILIVLVLVLFLALIVIVGYKCYKKQRGEHNYQVADVKDEKKQSKNECNLI